MVALLHLEQNLSKKLQNKNTDQTWCTKTLKEGKNNEQSAAFLPSLDWHFP